MIDEFNFQLIRAKEVANYIDDLATLRIKIFREYPYLYDGNFEYEKAYLSAYIKSSQSMLIAALFKDRIVGISSALPLKDETHELTTPFLENQLDINQFYYLGESVLLQEFRGYGIYKHFFAARESIAKEYGFKKAVFSAVKRTEGVRPSNYVPLDEVWHRFGYQKNSLLHTLFEWKDIDKNSPTQKTMEFWIKTL